MKATLSALYSLYQPFFGLQGRKLAHSIALASMIGINIALAFLLTLINASFNSFVGVLEVPGVTYTLFFSACAEFAGWVLLYSAIMAMNNALSRWLGESLAREKLKELETQWHQNNRAFLYRFINDPAKPDPAQILGVHTRQTSTLSISLLNLLLTTVFNTIVGITGLWRLSTPLVVNVFNKTWHIPGYMAIGAFTYSLVYNLIMNLAGRPFKTKESELKRIDGELQAELHHDYTFAEPIASRRGEQYQHFRLLGFMARHAHAFRSYFLASTVLDFIKTLHAQLSFAVGLILSSPGIIAKQLALAEVFESSEYFTYVVKLFTWSNDNYEETTAVSVGAEQMQKFEMCLNECDVLLAKKSYHIAYTEAENTDPIILHQLKVQTPTGACCLSLDDALHIPQQARVKIIGESGAGKTTLFRTLAGFWPYGEGNIQYAAKRKDVMMLSQESCFPMSSTLLDAILYPKTEPLTKSNKEQLIQWMNVLGLEKWTNALDETAAWGKRLSGGEKQRVGLLSLLLHQPKIAFLDESISALDKSTAKQAMKLLNTNLPNTTFLCIDHSQTSSHFYTHELSINTDKTAHLRKNTP